ncbi:MAG: hypothetical protein EOO43_19020, partial [Flavobacterium sp.]
MKRKFTHFNLWMIVIAIAISINCAFAGTTSNQDTTSILRKSKKAKVSYLKSGLPFSLPPLKPGEVSTTKFSVNKQQQQDSKLLNNVEVFPNPVTDQLNIKYEVSRNTNVTIKIVDVLGNDLATIFSQRVESGDQKFSY